MNEKEMGIIYDEFFGDGYWEEQDKNHIIVFAKKISDWLNNDISCRFYCGNQHGEKKETQEA